MYSMENNKETVETNSESKIGLEIESELKTLLEKGVSEISFDDLKTHAPKTAKVLYDAYDDDDESNGVETSNYSLLETSESGTFKLNKK